MSSDFTEADIATITLLLSPERLAALEDLTGSTGEAIALHQQTLRVGAQLMAVVAVLEIALRNAICDRLASHFQSQHWLLSPPPPFRWKDSERSKIDAALANARKSDYAKLTRADKRTLDQFAFPPGVYPPNYREHVNARQTKIKVSDGKIVAELTLFFWKRMFAREYDDDLWKPCLKRLFPNRQIRRADVATQLERLYQVRNRIAHHEPVAGRRLREALMAIAFIVENLGTEAPTPTSALGKLLRDDRAALNRSALALEEQFRLFRTPPI